MVCAALVVAGLRGPQGNTALAQAPPAKDVDATANSEKFSLRFVPAEAVLVAAIRPAELLAEPGIGDFLKKFDGVGKMIDATGVDPAKLAEATLIMLPGGQQPAEPHPLVVLRTNEAIDWKKVTEEHAPGAREDSFGGTTFYHARVGHREPAYFQPNDRTMVLGTDPQIRLVITMAQGGFDGLPGPSWAEEWNAQPAGQARVAVNVEVLKAVTGLDLNRLQDPNTPTAVAATLSAVGPLVKNVSAVVGSAQVNGGMKLSAVAATDSIAAAASVAETTIALKTLAKNMALQTRQSMLRQPDAPAGVPQLLAMLEDLLAKTEIKADDKLVRLSATSRYNGAMAAAIFMPAVAQARQSAQRMQDQNNLKQLALAMHNYAEANGSFPPAVLYGPDGTTPHSWRLALLPYVEQEGLYRQYNFNEPWDSPINRRVLEQAPAIFRSPSEDQRSKNSSYFVLTGPDTIYSDKQGTKVVEIPDGTSNTLLIVEAQRDVPWTKPEDIDYVPSQPLPKLGGFFPGGFNAAFADGSVRFLYDTIDEKMLRALITKAGGEPINPEDGAPTTNPGIK